MWRLFRSIACKLKSFPAPGMKAYKRSRVLSTLILNPCITWKQAINCRFRLFCSRKKYDIHQVGAWWAIEPFLTLWREEKSHVPYGFEPQIFQLLTYSLHWLRYPAPDMLLVCEWIVTVVTEYSARIQSSVNCNLNANLLSFRHFQILQHYPTI